MNNVSYLASNNKQYCSGCSACKNICAHKAIQMQEDNEGFFYPWVDEDKCVNCGLCSKICPIDNNVENADNEQHSYIGITNNQHFYTESATIGVCTMLTEHILSMGGCVYGVELNESDWKAYHVCINSLDEINRIRNSKYLQSNTVNTFEDVKIKLREGKLVLYIGTPCQIAGLKAYLRKDYENLYTVDIICHGVFSPKLMPLEAEYWQTKFQSKIHNFRFRSKRVYKEANHGMVNFDLESGDHIERHASASPSYHCFAYSGDGNNYNLRPSCYACKFRSALRYGDITVGDPWFVNYAKVKNKEIVKFKGAKSIFSANTAKGKFLLDEISEFLIKEELSREALFCQPAVKEANREIPSLREELYANVGKEEYGHLVERLFNCNLEGSHLDFDKAYKRAKVTNKLKKYLGMTLMKKILKRLYSDYTKMRMGFTWWWLNCVVCYFPSVHFRRFCLRRSGMQISKNVRFFEGVHVRNPKGIVMGDGCSIGTRVLLDGRLGLEVGKSVTFGYECIIWTMNHDYNDLNFTVKGGPVKIGDYAWICSRSIVLPGITIGEGAVVASGAIVTKDVPPYSIVAGIPAKVVGQRKKMKYEYGYNASNDYMHLI